MTTKDELIKQCDRGIKHNKWSLRFNTFMVGVNLFFCFVRYTESMWLGAFFHLAFLLLHLWLAKEAYNLINKWKSMKDTYGK